MALLGTIKKRGNFYKLVNLIEDSFPKAQLETRSSALREYGKAESFHPEYPPTALFHPRDALEVSEIVKIAESCDVPIIPFGAGTSLEGHFAAIFGGLTIDLSTFMNKVIKVNDDDFDVILQPGVKRIQLNHELKDYGLFFPIDPGANATLGGMVSTRASGTNSVKYGTMKQNVLNLECVVSGGKIIRTGSRAKKSSAGYDLTSLFVGAEGTLGVVTEITLKTYAIPNSIKTLVCSFSSTKQACDAVHIALKSGIPLAKAEFIDQVAVKAVNKDKNLGLVELPTIFFELSGNEGAVISDLEVLKELLLDLGANNLTIASTEEERSRIMQARHSALYSAMKLRPGSRALVTDVCVPLSKLSQCIVQSQNDLDEYGLLGPIVGHVGDGNFHVLLVYNPEIDGVDYYSRMGKFSERLVHRALGFEGTCTGEHGVGYGKAKWMIQEHGIDSVDLMRNLKASVDPKFIFNPGKILPH